MPYNRTIVQEAHACCEPYIEQNGQPASRTVEAFPPAATYADYANQEQELDAHLDQFGACVHIREITVRTHRTLCGNDEHRATAKRALLFGMDPVDFAAM
jgi:hypothetical protein